MFGWFGRKKREEKFMEELFAAYQEGERRRYNRDRLMAICNRYGLKVNPEKQDESLAFEVAVLVVRLAISKNGWSANSLTSDQEFTVMLLLFVCCDYLSQVTDTAFEPLTMAVPIFVFGGRDPGEIGKLIREAGKEFNRLATAPKDAAILQSMGSHVAAWVANQEPERMEKIAGMVAVLAKQVK